MPQNKERLTIFALLFSFVLLNGCGAAGAPPLTPHVSSVTVSPQFFSLTVGNAEQLTVKETLSDGSTVSPHSPNCSSSNANVAGVTSQIQVSALTAGAAVVTCS